MLNIRDTDDIRNMPIYFMVLMTAVFVEFYISLLATVWYLEWLAANHPELWDKIGVWTIG